MVRGVNGPPTVSAHQVTPHLYFLWLPTLYHQSVNRDIGMEAAVAKLSGEQWRILAALVGGAELLQRPGQDWLLNEQQIAFSDLQPLWDAELVTFRFPMRDTVHLHLTPAGVAAAGREAAD